MATTADISETSHAAGEGLLVFDRRTDRLEGATATERMAFAVLRLGSVLTMPFGHRGYRLGCAVVAGGMQPRDIAIRLNDDAVFSIPFGDGYWSRLLNPGYDYEDEIELLLRGAAAVDYTFVDGGANFGYWSVVASGAAFGSKDVLAIEAAPANARRLELNNALNGGRFRCLHAAIGRSPGYVRITGERHETLATEQVGEGCADAVRRVSLDGLVMAGQIDVRRPVIAKLEVEGVEIDAIDGARGLAARDCLFVCEEHGNDPFHALTRHLMGRTALKVYAFDPAAGNFVRVDELAVLDRLKRHPWVGYNVFATASPLWEEVIRGTTRGASCWRPSAHAVGVRRPVQPPNSAGPTSTPNSPATTGETEGADE